MFACCVKLRNLVVHTASVYYMQLVYTCMVQYSSCLFFSYSILNSFLIRAIVLTGGGPPLPTTAEDHTDQDLALALTLHVSTAQRLPTNLNQESCVSKLLIQECLTSAL